MSARTLATAEPAISDECALAPTPTVGRPGPLPGVVYIPTGWREGVLDERDRDVFMRSLFGQSVPHLAMHMPTVKPVAADVALARPEIVTFDPDAAVRPGLPEVRPATDAARPIEATDGARTDPSFPYDWTLDPDVDAGCPEPSGLDLSQAGCGNIAAWVHAATGVNMTADVTPPPTPRAQPRVWSLPPDTSKLDAIPVDCSQRINFTEICHALIRAHVSAAECRRGFTAFAKEYGQRRMDDEIKHFINAATQRPAQIVLCDAAGDYQLWPDAILFMLDHCTPSFDLLAVKKRIIRDEMFPPVADEMSAIAARGFANHVVTGVDLAEPARRDSFDRTFDAAADLAKIALRGLFAAGAPMLSRSRPDISAAIDAIRAMPAWEGSKN